MTKNSKSMKKFLATATATTIVAGVVAPMAFAANLTDINEHRHEEAIKALVEKGIISGYEDQTFQPNKVITRAEGAIMIARALDLLDGKDIPENNFSDVSENSKAYEAIVKLADLNIVSGFGNGIFGPEEKITRGQMAKYIANAYKLELGDGKTTFPDVAENAELAKYVDAIADAGIAGGYENGDFGYGDQLKRGDFAKMVYNAENLETAVVTPAVKSINALNAKQIVVEFNTELEGQSADFVNDATDASQYTLNSIRATYAELSNDKKSVTLTFTNGVEGNDQVVVVNPIATTQKDENGDVVNTVKYSGIFSYEDTVIPEIVSTSYENGKIILEFSEAIGTLPSVVRVNETPVTAIVEGNTPNKVEITYEVEAGSTATLYVAGAKDASEAKNEMSLFNGTVIAPTADTGKPQITGVQVTGQNTAKVTLSEDITEVTVEAKLQKGASIHNVSLVEDTTDTTGKTYTLTVDLNGNSLGDGIFSGDSISETFDLLVAAEAMTDLSSNKNEEFITNVTFVKDTKAPTLTATSLTSENKQFSFGFNETVVVTGSESNIVVKNADGVKIAVVNAETQLKLDNNKVYLVDIAAGEKAIDAGTYSVTIPAGFFQDQYGNATSEITSTFTVNEVVSTDTTKPVADVSTADKNVFQVAFKNGANGDLEEVTSSALNLNNYKLDGEALPEGTDIYFTNTSKNTVKIELPEGTINMGNQTDGTKAILTVANVQDKAGNALNTSNHSVTIKDNTAATIETVQVIGKDVYVTFTEDVTFTEPVAANTVFNVEVNDVSVSTTGNITKVDGNNKQVKFTLESAATDTPEVTILDEQTKLTDVNGVKVK